LYVQYKPRRKGEKRPPRRRKKKEGKKKEAVPFQSAHLTPATRRERGEKEKKVFVQKKRKRGGKDCC